MIDYSVRGAWQRVSETWADSALHEELFKLAIKHNCFAWVAARYREKGDDPIAKGQLERLRKAAVAAMYVSAAARPAKEKTPYRSSFIVLVVLLVAMLLGLVVTKSMHDNRKTPAVTQPARH